MKSEVQVLYRPHFLYPNRRPQDSRSIEQGGGERPQHSLALSTLGGGSLALRRLLVLRNTIPAVFVLRIGRMVLSFKEGP